MGRSMKALGTLALVCGLGVVAATAWAGWGDSLKKQADKMVKGEKKPAASSTDTGPVSQSRIEPKPTPETLAKFKASLELEVAERNRVTKFLTTVKPSDVYEKCKTEWMMGPEGQKLSQKYVEAMQGKSQEEIQKNVQVMGAETEKAIERHCGPDPGHYNQSWANEQIRAAIGRASDQFTKDDYAYASWKEWVAEFCNYVDELKKQPDAAQKLAKVRDEGLRIPGSGAGIYYVYTASEASTLLDQCDTLMPLLQATL
jgi:hypothetical protein